MKILEIIPQLSSGGGERFVVDLCNELSKEHDVTLMVLHSLDKFLSRSTVNTKETIEFEGETYPLVKLEISSSSHPFYTGKSKLVDTAGRVDKFMSRYGDRKKK